MIELAYQFKIIIYSILYSLVFTYSFILCKNYLCVNNYVFKTINTITFYLFFSIMYFIGLEIVCNGILHFYSILTIFFVGYIATKYNK